MAAMACGGDGDDEGSADAGNGATPDAGTSDPDADPVACAVTAWAAPDFTANAAGAIALRDELDALGALMRGAEEETTTVDDVSDLTALFEAGDPSLASVVTESYRPVVDDAFADFVALVGASAQDLIDDEGNWTPGKVGGLFGPDVRGINTGGLEVRQLVDKGLFGGAAMYSYAIGLTEGEITQATIDALAAAWGASASLDPGEVTDSANYGFQMGFHAPMAAALTAARAHAGDEACTAERDAALVGFFRAWEQSLVARTIYYANAAAGLIAEAPAGPKGDADKADALHEMAEGIGLTAGFVGLPDPASGPLGGSGRLLTDEDIDAMMTALGITDLTDLDASTTGQFVEDPALLQSAVGSFESTAIEVFGLSPADVESYRAPTEG